VLIIIMIINSLFDKLNYLFVLQEEQEMFSKILDLTYNLIKDDVIVFKDSDVVCLQAGVLAALCTATIQLR
jgi:hypothetical protein